MNKIDKALNIGLILIIVLILGHWIAHNYFYKKEINLFPNPQEVEDVWETDKK